MKVKRGILMNVGQVWMDFDFNIYCVFYGMACFTVTTVHVCVYTVF